MFIKLGGCYRIDVSEEISHNLAHHEEENSYCRQQGRQLGGSLPGDIHNNVTLFKFDFRPYEHGSAGGRLQHTSVRHPKGHSLWLRGRKNVVRSWCRYYCTVVNE